MMDEFRYELPRDGSTLKFEVHTGLECLPEGCIQLLDAAPSFGLSVSWFRNMVIHGVHPTANPCFGVLTDGASVLGVLPLQHTNGSGFSSLTNCYTCIYHPLIGQGLAAEETAYLLGKGLGRLCLEQPLSWMESLPAEWPALEAFEAGVGASRLAVRKFDFFGNWYEPVTHMSWNDYLASRPGKLRELLRRRRRDAARRGISCEIVDRGDRLGSAMETFEAVYSRSWKKPEPFPRFNQGLMYETDRLGILRLGICWREDKPIAVQLWIVDNGTAIVMKLAHDEAEASLSPGTLLTAAVIEHLMKQEELAEIDFGRGDDPYKQLWTGYRRQRIGLLIANPRRFRAWKTLGRHDAGRAARWIQQRLHVTTG